MRFADLKLAAFQTLQSTTAANADPVDQTEAHRLRARVLGVIIRLGRIAAERTMEDCAQIFRVDPKLIEAWELGSCVPSLPQLERLASYFESPETDVVLGANSLSQLDNEEYLRLRHRLVGALLQSARRAQESSIDEISALTGLDEKLLQRYEYGAEIIPMHHLALLAHTVKRDLSYFTDQGGFSSFKARAAKAETAAATVKDQVLAEFAADSRNNALIRLAMAFRDIDRDDLDRIASALMAISHQRRDPGAKSPT